MTAPSSSLVAQDDDEVDGPEERGGASVSYVRLFMLVLLATAVVAAGPAAGARDQTPKRGGTVVVGDAYLVSEPACLNFIRFGCGSELVIDEVLEGAFEFGGGVVRPNLVSHVEYTTRPPFTLTYHIRPEARWSDGASITARDFEFTYRAMLRHWPKDVDFLERTQVRSARAVGPKALRVVLKSRFAGWRRLFLFVLPRHALAGESLLDVWRDRLDNPKTGQPIGSGPFLLERWDRGRQIVLRRNPRYWGPHLAYLDRVILRVGSETSLATLGEKAIAGFDSGEIDVHHRRGDPALESDFRRLRGVRHLSAPGEGWEHLAIRVGPGGHPALRKKLVRRALANGIDRVAIVRDVFGRIDPRLQPSDSAIYPTGSPYYRPNWSTYRYRPALARSLLEQAGCRRGTDGIYSCDGERLRLRFVTIAGVPRRSRVLELVPSQLRAAGIEAVPSYIGGASFFDPFLPNGDWDVAVFLFFRDVEPLLLERVYGCGGQANFTGYCQRLVTADLDQADRILDAENQARVLNRVDAQLARDVPVIPLWQEPAVATIRSNIRGLRPSFPYLAWNAENWWLAESR